MPALAETANHPDLAVPRALFTGAPQDRAALLSAPIRSIPRPSLLDAPLTGLKGVGPRIAAAAAEAGLRTLGDVLGHVPHGYRDRRARGSVGGMAIGQEATLLVEVRSVRTRPTRRRGLSILEAVVFDETGPITATWFNQAWLADKLQPGTKVLVQGKMERRGLRVSAHEIVDADSGTRPLGLHTTGLVPVHPATEKLKPQKLREWAWEAVGLAPQAIESLPARLRARRGLAAAADALSAVHFPAEEAAAAFLASFGDSIEVVDPPGVRRLLAEIGRRLVERYR